MKHISIRQHFSKAGEDLLFAFAVATLSLCSGITLNVLRDKPIPWIYKTKEQRIQESVARLLPGSSAMAPGNKISFKQNLSLTEFRNFSAEKRGLVLDARPEIFFRFGHVPGSLSLPSDDFESGYSRLKPALERDHNQLIAVYCTGESCDAAKLLCDALQRLGYTHVAVFSGGWNEWIAAGFPEEKSQ